MSTRFAEKTLSHLSLRRQDRSLQALPGQGFSSQPFSDHTLMPVPTTQKPLVLGFFYAALAAALWSLITPFSRLLFGLDTSPLETAFWRSLFGGACFVAYSLVKGCLKVPFRDGVRMLLFGGLLGALMFGAFQLSIEMSGGATAVVLLYTAPAWVAVLSRVLFHEAISRTKLLAIAIALAGVVLVSLSFPGQAYSAALPRALATRPTFPSPSTLCKNTRPRPSIPTPSLAAPLSFCPSSSPWIWERAQRSGDCSDS